MPRKRMISPDIWTDPKFAALTDDTTRLLFIGLFSNANDYGKLRGEWWSVRSMIFPRNELPREKIESMLEELEKRDLIARYKVEDEKYIKLVNWDKHQKVQHPSTDNIPDPPEDKTRESLTRLSRDLHPQVKLSKVKRREVKSNYSQDKKRPDYKFSEDDLRLTKKLKENILQINPGHVFRGEAWEEKNAEQIRLMRHYDKRASQDIEAIIDFAFKDKFWSGVIQSVFSLRKNYDMMKAQIRAKPGETETQRLARELREKAGGKNPRL